MKAMKNRIAPACAVAVAVIILLAPASLAQLSARTVAPPGSGTGDAKDIELPEPGALPGTFMYGFKRVVENLRVAFTFDSGNKANLLLEFAETRLAEIRELPKDGRFVPGLLEDFEVKLRNAAALGSGGGVEKTAAKGLEFLKDFASGASESAKQRAGDAFGEVSKILRDAAKPGDTVCIQVITTARNPISGNVKEFPTPCDVPPGWEVEQ